MRIPFGSSELDIFAGLDIDMATMKFTATFNDDGEDGRDAEDSVEIASAESKINLPP